MKGDRLSRRPKRGVFWCMKCDRTKVGESKKCRFCGYRNGRRRNRK